MNATEIKEALALGKDATRSTWEEGTFITQVPETETFEKVFPDGSKEPYEFALYDEHESDWSLVESTSEEPKEEVEDNENPTEENIESKENL